jgi:photosystem II stability/assembly factor-like uncharacterized protein
MKLSLPFLLLASFVCRGAEHLEPEWKILSADDAIGGASVLSANGKSVFVGGYFGLMYSPDEGESWKYPTDRSPGAHIPIINGIHATGSRIYAATSDNAILMSLDSGATWGYSAKPPQGSQLRGAFATDSALLAGTYYHGIYRSMDSGKTWVQSGGDLAGGAFGRFKSLGNTIVTGSLYRGLFYSEDDGRNWKKPQSGIPDSIIVSSVGVARPGSGKAIVFASGAGILYRSEDTCKNWKSVPIPDGALVNQVEVFGSEILVGTKKHGVLHASLASGDWKSLGTGYSDTSAVWFLAAGERMVYASGSDFKLWGLRMESESVPVRPSESKRKGRLARMNPVLRTHKLNGAVFRK